MEMLSDTGKVLSAELVEVNPILDHRNTTARLGVELLASLLGKKILYRQSGISDTRNLRPRYSSTEQDTVRKDHELVF